MTRRPRRTPDRDGWRALRAVRQWRVDQVLLRRSGGRVVAFVSMVGPDGGLRSERVYPPTSDPAEALRLVGRQVAGLGNVELSERLRIRWSHGESLVPDEDLLVRFRDAFEAELDSVRDRIR